MFSDKILDIFEWFDILNSIQDIKIDIISNEKNGGGQNIIHALIILK